MPLLTIQNLPGAVLDASPDASLLAVLQAAGYDWMHACGAKGRCTTCRIEMLSGAEGLSPLSDAEQRYRAARRLQAHERLACQARLLSGNAVGRVPKATQLPHVHYAE